MSTFQGFLQRKNIVISWQRYGIEALSAMAQGLFCSLLIGTIINLDVFENMCANAEKGLMKVGISTCAESCAAGAPAQAKSCSTAELNQAQTTPKTDWTH